MRAAGLWLLLLAGLACGALASGGDGPLDRVERLADQLDEDRPTAQGDDEEVAAEAPPVRRKPRPPTEDSEEVAAEAPPVRRKPRAEPAEETEEEPAKPARKPAVRRKPADEEESEETPARPTARKPARKPTAEDAEAAGSEDAGDAARPARPARRKPADETEAAGDEPTARTTATSRGPKPGPKPGAKPARKPATGSASESEEDAEATASTPRRTAATGEDASPGGTRKRTAAGEEADAEDASARATGDETSAAGAARRTAGGDTDGPGRGAAAGDSAARGRASDADDGAARGRASDAGHGAGATAATPGGGAGTPGAGGAREVKPLSRTSIAKMPVVATDELVILDQAIGHDLKQQRMTPLVVAPVGSDDQLMTALNTLDQSLSAQLTKRSGRAQVEMRPDLTSGLAELLGAMNAEAPPQGAAGGATAALTPPDPAADPAGTAGLQARLTDPTGAPPGSTPAAASGGQAPTASGSTAVAALDGAPSGTPASPAPNLAPATAGAPAAGAPTAGAPAPAETAEALPGPEATSPAALASPLPVPAHRVGRYVLSRLLVSRDGGIEELVPVPGVPGPVRAVQVAHAAGGVQLALGLKLPAAIVLGESTQLTADARATGAGAADLTLCGEPLEPATTASDALVASGQVTFSSMRRVGGTYAYQQSFAGSSRTALRSVLLNWTDREPSLELPFSWGGPGTRIAGRAVYLPRR